MNILVLLRMLFGRTSVSAEQACHGSTIHKLFWAMIVPLSLLPPTMIVLLEATPSGYLPILQIRPSVFMASLFFACEVLSVFLMGWLIKQVASTLGHEVAYVDAYLVAAIAPIPLWLSSLGLLVNNPFLNTALPLSALVSSCALFYQGTYSLCRVGDRPTAAAVTQVVFGAGLTLWLMFLPLFWSVTG